MCARTARKKHERECDGGTKASASMSVSSSAVGPASTPLDGVGARVLPERIRTFIVADDAVRSSLSPSVARTKAAYAVLPTADLDALVSFLTMLR